MKRPLALLPLLLAAAFAQPKIATDRTTVPLDTIAPGEVRTVTIALRNDGDAPLTVTNIETSCGCTSAQKDIPPIAPGGSGAVTVQFNSAGFDGRIRKEVMIYSNDPKVPLAVVTLTGLVWSPLETVPKMAIINLGAAPSGSPAEHRLSLRNISGRPVRVLSVTSADPSLQFHPSAFTVAPSDTVPLRITYTPRGAGLVDQTFTVRTADPKRPALQFRLMYAGQ
ncbi:MAG: DUF1573 domain-containing protein [Bacteroidetes bacterium]|nr:MAG: DUF1573 domain-containing protein [Bacteroidota bacterium]